MKTTILLALAASAGMLHAQTASLSALSPVTVQVQLGGQAQSASVPIGPLPTIQGLQAELGVAGSANNALSGLFWSVLQQQWSMGLSVTHYATVASTTAASAEVVSCDLLLQLTNPTPIQVLVNLDRSVVASAGVPAPTMRIDIGNDGTFELTETSSLIPAGIPAALGPTPLPVRVQYVGAIASPGMLRNNLQIEVTPVGVYFQDVAVGCDYFHHLFAAPTFDGGVTMYVTGAQAPAVIVLGLSPQPVILPAPTQWLPCVLIPSPDALVYLPDNTLFSLPIPPAVRPITVFVQPVMVWPTSLQTANGLQMNAL
jgi:hypothetical protein